MEEKTNHPYSDEMEIDLSGIFKLMWRYLWLILVCAILAGAIGFGISRFAITPLYESTTQVYIIDRKDNETSSLYIGFKRGTQLTEDYEYIIKSRKVLEEVIEKLGLNETYDSLSQRVKVTTPTDGRILEITVSHPTPLMAQRIVNEIRDVAQTSIKNVTNAEAINLVDEGELPMEPSGPSVGKWTVTGFLIGGFLCMIVLLIRFFLDDTIKDSEDVERFLGLGTLARIPVMDEKEARKEMLYENKIALSDVDGMAKKE